VDFWEISRARQTNSPEAPIANSKFHKRNQHFICTHNETPSAMRICNPDRSPFGISR
jgi:hypothetical protein